MGPSGADGAEGAEGADRTVVGSNPGGGVRVRGRVEKTERRLDGCRGFGFVVAGIDVRARGDADDGRGGLFLECIHILRRGARGRRARREGSPSGVPADAQRLGGITDVSLVVIALVGRGEGKGTRRPANMAALRVREMWGRGRARAARARRRAQRRTHHPERRAVRGGRVSTGRFRRLTG